MRRYNNPIYDFAYVMTVQEWNVQIQSGSFVPDDGSGFWCKDGKESEDDSFSTPPEDATHVAWYNK